MDRPYSHVHSESSPPLLSSAQPLITDVFTTEVSPSRQQRLLQHRNARFPAKKLSISGLGNKLTLLIGNNDSTKEKGQEKEQRAPTRDQENRLHKSRSTSTLGTRKSLGGVLDEISNSTRGRPYKKRPGIPIYQDHPERPLLDTSPLVASSPPVQLKSDFTSPLGFDHIQDSVTSMRSRQRPFDDPWSPMVRSPPSSKLPGRKRSIQTPFDSEEYIEHIEKELQQTRDEAYSPLTRRPIKEKLRAANKENERLLIELCQLKEFFETEVKRTVEHKTRTEVDLKRKVRDLELSVEEKSRVIHNFQYQHEEKRLDNGLIDSLKTTIERLEQEKRDMEEINLGMNKRNEVLTQLLAMSPTKPTGAFNLTSPIRENRKPRPMSLILPRQPLSPRQFSQASSLACSPQPLSTSAISPLKLSPTHSDLHMSQFMPHPEDDQDALDLQRANHALRSPRVPNSLARRWTMLSDVSANAVDDARPTGRRKARKFGAGSTQLKPLLLPTLAGDNFPSASSASSPRCWPVEVSVESGRNLIPRLPETENMNRDQPSVIALDYGLAPDPLDRSNVEFEDVQGPNQDSNRDYAIPDVDASYLTHATEILGLGLPLSMCRDPLDTYEAPISEPFSPYRTSMPGTPCDSLHAMPVPSTPDSLVPRPLPLFTPSHQARILETREFVDRCGSRSPVSEAERSINLVKRRQPWSGDTDLDACVHRAPRHTTFTATIEGESLADLSQQHLLAGSGNATAPSSLRLPSSDNFVEVLRTKNFAVKPLTAITVRTVYRILSTCASTLRGVKRDPFALGRKMLANAWHVNWHMLGKLSWWVLGLFVQPPTIPRTYLPVDWDKYDGESIANRYCGLALESNDDTKNSSHAVAKDKNSPSPIDHREQNCVENDHTRPSWSRSLLLWGKFSAAMMLAVSGAVIKGPGEMLKDVKQRSSSCRSNHLRCESCGVSQYWESPAARNAWSPDDEIFPLNENGNKMGVSSQYDATDFDIGDDSQLDSSSLLQQLQQPDYGSTIKPNQTGRGNITGLFTPLNSPIRLLLPEQSAPDATNIS